MNKLPILMCRMTNWGDSLNRILIPLISGKEIIAMNKKGLDEFSKSSNETVYSCVGSVLGWASAQVEVWGSGFISNSQNITTIQVPRKIHAVRGPLTREILLKKGIDCPMVFGDPALLMPYFYRPEITVEHELGFIPHHIDKVLIPQLQKQFPEAHFIDIQLGTYEFIDEVLKCKQIITSSLHGQIIADAYNISNAWIKLSDKVLGRGFKFKDYFASVRRIDQEPLIYTKELKRKDLIDKLAQWNSAKIDLGPLWNACPFNNISLYLG